MVRPAARRNRRRGHSCTTSWPIASGLFQRRTDRRRGQTRTGARVLSLRSGGTETATSRPARERQSVATPDALFRVRSWFLRVSSSQFFNL